MAAADKEDGMADNAGDGPKAEGGAADTLLKAVKLEWVRPLIYNLGGRKLAVGGGGLAIISQIVAAGPMDWPKAVACLAVAVVSVGTALSIASEDKGNGGAGK